MRAAGAEVRGPIGKLLGFCRDRDRNQSAFLGESFCRNDALQPSLDRPGNVFGEQAAEVGDHGAAFVVAFAENAWCVGAAVEDVANLRLNERTFLFDHDDFFEAVGEAGQTVWLKRPDQCWFVETNASARQISIGRKAHLGESVT